MKYTFLLSFLLISLGLQAQDGPIGQWTTHFSFQSARSVAYNGDDYIYAADNSLYRYSIEEQSFDIFSKVNGLSDIGVKLMRYNQIDDYLLIVYDNGNIDLLIDNNFINLPDIKNLNTSGSKNINEVFFYNSLIYLSTDFGVVVVNPLRKEIKETYVLQVGSNIAKVKSFTLYHDNFLAATDLGLFSASENLPVLQDYTKWDLLTTNYFTHLNSHPTDYIFGVVDSFILFSDSPFIASWDTIGQTQEDVVRLVQGTQKVYFLENGDTRRKIWQYDVNGTLDEEYNRLNAFDLTEVKTKIYIADGWSGLQFVENANSSFPIRPEGPYSNSSFNICVENNDLYISGGGHNAWVFNYQRDGISRYDYTQWKNYNQFTNVPAMDSFLDILDVAVDKRNQAIYAASFGGGLIEIAPDLSVKSYKDNGFFQPFGGPNVFRLVDLEFDQNNNLWMSNYGSSEPLVVKKADGTWQSYSMPYPIGSSEKTASQIAIDDFDQKWLVAPRNLGLFVFNDNGTLDNKNDDQAKILRQGSGSGNLPNNFVNCIAKDKDGAMWVGTTDGIAIYNCPGSMFTADGCEAELRIVQYDANAGLLFQNENIRALAVDGANNKWVGTGNGIWQISDDAETILRRFTIDNSPLPSNEINKIVVHPVTGDVFIATTAGLISYRGEATEGSETSENILIFPNPVPSGYGGTIGISGLTENADVRITDVSGQLIYRVKAQGGQAVWNGKTYTGQRPMSGVYYVFVTDKEGKETKSAKFIFHE